MLQLSARFTSLRATTNYGRVALLRPDGQVFYKETVNRYSYDPLRDDYTSTLDTSHFIPIPLPSPAMCAVTDNGTPLAIITVEGQLYSYNRYRLTHHPCDQPLVSITAGRNRALAADGSVYIFRFGELTPFSLPGPVKQISAGDRIACFLLVDGRVLVKDSLGKIQTLEVPAGMLIQSIDAPCNHCSMVMTDGRALIFWLYKLDKPEPLDIDEPAKYVYRACEIRIALTVKNEVYQGSKHIKFPGPVAYVSGGYVSMVTLQDGRVFGVVANEASEVIEFVLPV